MVIESKKVKGLSAYCRGVFDRSENPGWTVQHQGTSWDVYGAVDNRAAARKKMYRIEQQILSEQANITEERKVSSKKPAVMQSLVEGLSAKQTGDADASEWSIVYRGTVLRVINNTQDNREAARRALKHLEFKTEDDLEKMRKEKIAANKIKPALAKPVFPKATSKNTKLQIQIRKSGPAGIESEVFELGEFVHDDNAKKRYDQLRVVLKNLAATYE